MSADPWARRGLVVDRIRDALGRSGTTIAAEEVEVEVDGDDVVAARPTIGYEWRENVGHQDRRRIRRRFRTDARESAVVAAADRFGELAGALRERERAIEPHRNGDRVPAWSLLIEPLALHLLRLTGIPDEKLLEPYRPMGGRFAADGHGFTMGDSVERVGVAGWQASSVSLAINAGVLNLRRMDLTSPTGSRIGYDGGPRASLRIQDAGALPDSVMSTLSRGGRVGDVVEASPVAGSDARFTSGARENGMKPACNLVLRLKRDLVRMGPAPAGLDTSWMSGIRAGLR